MTTPSRTGSNQLNASAGNLSTSATIPANTNLAVAFWAHWASNGGSSASSLSINSVAMTIASQLAEGAVTDESGVGVAYLVSPGTGSLTHALTWSAGGARTEAGEAVFVYYQDGNTSDPVRASGTNAATVATAAAVNLASTASTDMVVGLVDNFNDQDPQISGVTAFINSAALNSHLYDVGEATGLTGTVTISSANRSYTCTAGISLKASVAAGASARSRFLPSLGVA